MSDSNRPDSDWSQIRETIKLLNLSVAQVDSILQESEASVNTLTDSFTEMVASMHIIHDHLLAITEHDMNVKHALEHCAETKDKVQAAVIAFQFYDRMQQCLHHVTSNLRGLSKLVEDPERLYNPEEWRDFQNQIRSRYTMESEKIMFDAILQGSSIDEAIATKNILRDKPSDDIELF